MESKTDYHAHGLLDGHRLMHGHDGRDVGLGGCAV